jgi:hypothetical protein
MLHIYSLCTRWKMGHSSQMADHNQHTFMAIAHWQVCQVVKPHCVPRCRWNMQRVKSRSHTWLEFSSSTHDTTLTTVFHIVANSFPQVSVKRFSKSIQLMCDQLRKCRASQRSISVEAQSSAGHTCDRDSKSTHQWLQSECLSSTHPRAHKTSLGSTPRE